MIATSVRRLCNVAAITLAVLSSGCSQPAPAPAVNPEVVTADSQPDFANKVWRVAGSPSAAEGTLYVFLSRRNAVIMSSTSRPALGTWKRNGTKALTMIEEGIAYPVEILELRRDLFRIRMSNPGEPVELTFARADQ